MPGPWRRRPLSHRSGDLRLLAFRITVGHMTRTPAQGSRRSPRPPHGSKRPTSAGKVAITVRLDRAQARQLQAVAAAENRSITNYVETALIRDLVLRDEAARVIAVRAAPGTSARIAPEDVVRGEGEPDPAYARRQALLTELWSIPDDH